MDSSKRENLLNLALDATQEEREKSLELNVGYSLEDRTWDVIVKYSGSLSELEETFPQMQIVELSNEYAIITLPQYLMDALSARIEIEYIEKPKRLFFSVAQGIRSSCITPLYGSDFRLSGRNCLVCIIDSGIDYFHPDFRNPNGTTRIAYLWDQTIAPRTSDGTEEEESDWQPPEGYRSGVEFDEAQINLALQQATRQEAYRI